MIDLTPRARRQVRELAAFYLRVERPEALRNLVAAVAEAAHLIEHSPSDGRPAPRPYPELARAGQAWIKIGPYWVRDGTRAPQVITGVFYETADIPGRA